MHLHRPHSPHGHHHHEGAHEHDHAHSYRSVAKSRLLLSLIITAAVMGVEAVGGVLANSIALISDAAHMFTHAFALGISLIAIYLASSPPGSHRTYGLFRAEVLASLLNGLFLLAVTIIIVHESFERFLDPRTVHSKDMFVIACIGLFVNLLTVWILRDTDKQDRNVRSAFMHMLADALSSVAVVAGAIVIHFTGMSIIDPILGIVISVLIFVWAWGLLKDSVRVLLEIAPKGMDTDTIKSQILSAAKGILNVTDLHVVEITSGMYDLSAHLEISGDSVREAEGIVETINEFLRTKYNIYHTTIQVNASADGKGS